MANFECGILNFELAPRLIIWPGQLSACLRYVGEASALRRSSLDGRRERNPRQSAPIRANPRPGRIGEAGGLIRDSLPPLQDIYIIHLQFITLAAVDGFR